MANLFLFIIYCAKMIIANAVFFATSSKYADTLPDTDGIFTKDKITLAECTLVCCDMKCVSIYYSYRNNECRLYQQRPFEMKLVKKPGWTVRHLEGEITSWATELVSVSSEYGNTEWNGAQALGKPDVYPQHNDNELAWAFSNKGSANEWITLGFPEKLYLKEISIYETYHAGGIVEVAGRRSDVGWHILWFTHKPADLKRSRIFKLTLKKPYFKTDVIRITVDGTACDSWPEIDAVKVVGEHRAY